MLQSSSGVYSSSRWITPNLSRRGAESCPERVVAPISVNFGIENIVLHRRVKHFLNLTGKAVYLVDEKHVVGLEVGQQSRQIPRLLDRRTGGHADIHAHLVRDNTRKRGLSESGRAVEQNMIEAFTALFRSLDIDLHVLLDLILTDVLVKHLRAQGILDIGI